MTKKKLSKKSAAKKPTDAELAILGVIWERGSATVREVHEQLSATQETGYTTVLKLMQIMVEKELLTKDASVRPQVFSSGQAFPCDKDPTPSDQGNRCSQAGFSRRRTGLCENALPAPIGHV